MSSLPYIKNPSDFLEQHTDVEIISAKKDTIVVLMSGEKKPRSYQFITMNGAKDGFYVELPHRKYHKGN